MTDADKTLPVTWLDSSKVKSFQVEEEDYQVYQQGGWTKIEGGDLEPIDIELPGEFTDAQVIRLIECAISHYRFGYQIGWSACIASWDDDNDD